MSDSDGEAPNSIPAFPGSGQSGSSTQHLDRSWLDSKGGRLLRWFLTYGLPMYLIVGALIYIGLQGLWSGDIPHPVEALPRQSMTNTNTTGAPLQGDPAAVPLSATGTDDARSITAIAKLAMDSTKDRVDALKESYEKLFAVIATLGALLAFLGFKGVESFLLARTKAQETLEKAEKAVEKADAAKSSAEQAIESLKKFLHEDYPRDNRAEVNVAHGLVMREIAEVYGALSVACGGPKGCEQYIESLEQSLRYLNKVPYGTPGLDPKIACRALVSVGNVKRRLGDVRGALEACQQVLENFDGNDVSAHYNVACYSCLLAQNAARNGRHGIAKDHAAQAIASLRTAVELDRQSQERARADDDFAWFRDRKDPSFMAILDAS